MLNRHSSPPILAAEKLADMAAKALGDDGGMTTDAKTDSTSVSLIVKEMMMLADKTGLSTDELVREQLAPPPIPDAPVKWLSA